MGRGPQATKSQVTGVLGCIQTMSPSVVTGGVKPRSLSAHKHNAELVSGRPPPTPQSHLEPHMTVLFVERHTQMPHLRFYADARDPNRDAGEHPGRSPMSGRGGAVTHHLAPMRRSASRCHGVHGVVGSTGPAPGATRGGRTCRGRGGGCQVGARPRDPSTGSGPSPGGAWALARGGHVIAARADRKQIAVAVLGGLR
jgi:hypothetical protein